MGDDDRHGRAEGDGVTGEVVVVRAWFLRAMGLVYLVAFASFWSQADGLVGSRGILPVAEFLQRSAEGADFWRLPTLLWIDAFDFALHALCGAGTLCAMLVIAGVAPAPALVGCWVCYLSVFVAGQLFLSYQWDILLLEAGFLTLWWAPLSLTPRRVWPSPPSRTITWLLRWLLFRLMWSSGLVKILGGDPTWRDLTAMEYHYQTQPIPVWTSWFAHHLPPVMHTAETLATFAIELVLPFAIFAPRRFRLAAAAAFALLQLMIAATGNYGFFNLLSLVLCLPLLDAAVLGRLGSSLAPAVASVASRAWPRWLVLPVACVVLVVSTLNLAATLRLDIRRAGVLFELHRQLRPLRLSSTYGLFAHMTTSRPEIVVEGSRDGRDWRPYEFRYKPTDPERRPAFAGVHMPRLDWQMWFAALRGYERAPWFGFFAGRLLEGSSSVLELLAADPFAGGGPPRYLRARLFDYRFSDPRGRGAWWERTYQRPYTPVLSLRRAAGEG